MPVRVAGACSWLGRLHTNRVLEAVDVGLRRGDLKRAPRREAVASRALPGRGDSARCLNFAPRGAKRLLLNECAPPCMRRAFDYAPSDDGSPS
jgi:hypothetical protein